MEISGKNFYINKCGLKSTAFSASSVPPARREYAAAYSAELPSAYPSGMAQVNANLPVSYSLVAEIPVPGLKTNAKVYMLSNGQKAVIAPKNGPVVIKTTYNTGSMNEPDHLRGISHFIEHNLFNGSRNLKPKEYDQKVHDLGGSTNASTDFSYTNYYIKFHPLKDNSLEEAVKLNAEQTQFPIFPIEQLEKEKEPVKSEIDMCRDNPHTAAIQKVIKNLFKIQSSSEDVVAGTKENINSFTREKVLDYYNTWYTPDNAVTVITGNVNPDEAVNLVSKYFNKQNDYSLIHKRYYEPLKYNDKPIREDIIKPNNTQPFAVLGFIVKEGTPRNELDKLSVLFNIMTSKNSSLYKALDKLNAGINIGTETLQNKKNSAKALILTVSAPEAKLEDAVKTVYAEITKIINNPPAIEEVNNAKQKEINNILSISENSEQLNAALLNAVSENDCGYFYSAVNTVQNITPDVISKTAEKYLDLNKVSMCVSHNKDTSDNEIINNYKKANVLFKGSALPLRMIEDETSEIIHTQLPNNIESTVIPGNAGAKSNFCLNFKTDELNDTPCSAFLILSEMLNRGSSARGADNFSRALEAKDIKMHCSVMTDGLSAAADCTAGSLPETIMLFKEKMLNPNFTKEEFERAKQAAKEAVIAEEISADDKLNEEMFPDIRLYADKETRLKELEKLTLEDIKEFYSKILNTSKVHAHLTAPVDINPALKDLFNYALSDNFGIFKPHTNEKGANYNIYKPNEKEKIITQVKEQAQAEIAQGYKFKRSRNIDDIAKIELLNMILGANGLGSRLFLDLREDKKLAYSVYSRLRNEKDTGVLSLHIETTTESKDPKEGSPENIVKALEGFKRNVNLLKTQNVSHKELEDVKTKLKVRILNGLETNMDKTISFASAKNTDYGIEYHKKLFEAIDKITPEDIKAAANYVFKNPPVTSIAAGSKTLNPAAFMLA